MPVYAELLKRLEAAPRRWLVTGVAGFIGSHLLETLLRLGQEVVGLDNFSTGKRENLAAVSRLVGQAAWARFRFIEGDIRDAKCCQEACEGVAIVLHQAALGSVPRSMADPLKTTNNNVDGAVALFVAAKAAGIQRLVYASSSSVYGDHPDLPKVEDKIGRPLSPYALGKQVVEQYAELFHRVFGLELVGLRYFNVFGPRQDPDGPYAAVIPRWCRQLVRNESVEIFGDGETSRDFCYVANVVQANLLAAVTPSADLADTVLNIACSSAITLNRLFELVRAEVGKVEPRALAAQVRYLEFRPGDVRHSLADISRAERLLGYRPSHEVVDGLREASRWYCENLR